jgi:hypothetical protein
MAPLEVHDEPFAVPLLALLSSASFQAALPQRVPLGPEFRVNTYTTSIHSRPRAAVDGSGNFVVAWSSFPQDEADSEGTFGQRFSPILPVELTGLSVE